MDMEKRVRDIIRNAEPNAGLKYPHWLRDGWFIIVQKTQVKLYKCMAWDMDSRKGRLITTEPRNGKGYANIMALID